MNVRSAISGALRAGAMASVAGAGACDRTAPAFPAPPPLDPAAHEAEVAAWHAWRLDDLRRPDGWLALAGLHWLEPGTYRMGAAADHDLVLAAASVPTLGTMMVRESTVTLTAAVGADLRVNGEPVTTLVMAAPGLADPPTIRHGSLAGTVIRRNERFALRVWDTLATTRRGFEGIDRFGVRAAFRFGARFEPYDPPKPIDVPNYLGYVSEYPSPGAVVFAHAGNVYRLDVTDQTDTAYFVPFGDPTNGIETYGGGRFVWFPAPDASGATVIDFNRAYNPPCVFTPYATCPLPPRQNRLDFRVPAGERDYRPSPDEPG